MPPADTRRFDFHAEVSERRDPRLEVQRLGGGNIRAVLKDPGCPLEYGAKDNYIRLTPRALTGRRFKVNKPDLWNTRLNDSRRSSFE